MSKSERPRGTATPAKVAPRTQMLRTWLSALNEAYPNPAEPLDINHPLVPWLCRWVAFVWARFHVQADNMTPFRIVSGRDYATPIVEFGEVGLVQTS